MANGNDPSSELAAAAAPTMREISRLADTAPPRIAAMVIYIRDHLFDPKLSVHRIKEACRLRDNSIALHFHRILGQPPGTFITDRRLAVAERLLSDTWLPIWKITDLLGYSSIQVFSRAYFRRKGRRPSAARKDGAGESVAAASIPSPGEATPFAAAISLESDFLRRALEGSLEDHEAAFLLSRLLELYPPHRRAGSVACPK